MTTSKRPKPLQVDLKPPLAPTGMAAATIGNAVQRILGDKAGFILIVVDAAGASLSTSEDPEEAVNVMSHFVKNEELFKNGYTVIACPCSRCQTYRREAH